MFATTAVNTHAMFDVLLVHWRAVPGSHATAGECAGEHMARARSLLQDALMRYQPWMDANDIAQYERLLQARDADELGGQFFYCFDLMVRVRGTTVAARRMHELFWLLQPHVTR